MATVPFQAFAESSHGSIVETRAMRAEPMHLVKSAAPSGSIRLHCSIDFGSRN